MRDSMFLFNIRWPLRRWISCWMCRWKGKVTKETGRQTSTLTFRVNLHNPSKRNCPIKRQQQAAFTSVKVILKMNRNKSADFKLATIFEETHQFISNIFLCSCKRNMFEWVFKSDTLDVLLKNTTVQLSVPFYRCSQAGTSRGRSDAQLELN